MELANWKNPFRESYIWIKSELLDIKGMYDALMGRENLIKQQASCDSKKRADILELDKLNAGKQTLKTFFKSSSKKDQDKVNLQNMIDYATKDIEEYKKLINFLTIYLGEVAIPKFKDEKKVDYLKALNLFCIREISNSHSSATLWHSLLEMTTSTS